MKTTKSAALKAACTDVCKDPSMTDPVGPHDSVGYKRFGPKSDPVQVIAINRDGLKIWIPTKGADHEGIARMICPHLFLASMFD